MKRTTPPATSPTAAPPHHPTGEPTTSVELRAFVERVIVPALVDRWFQLEDLADRRDSGGQKVGRRP